jgi:hypothetical protein
MYQQPVQSLTNEDSRDDWGGGEKRQRSRFAFNDDRGSVNFVFIYDDLSLTQPGATIS